MYLHIYCSWPCKQITSLFHTAEILITNPLSFGEFVSVKYSVFLSFYQFLSVEPYYFLWLDSIIVWVNNDSLTLSVFGFKWSHFSPFLSLPVIKSILRMQYTSNPKRNLSICNIAATKDTFIWFVWHLWRSVIQCTNKGWDINRG